MPESEVAINDVIWHDDAPAVALFAVDGERLVHLRRDCLQAIEPALGEHAYFVGHAAVVDPHVEHDSVCDLHIIPPPLAPSACADRVQAAWSMTAIALRRGLAGYRTTENQPRPTPPSTGITVPVM